MFNWYEVELLAEHRLASAEIRAARLAALNVSNRPRRPAVRHRVASALQTLAQRLDPAIVGSAEADCRPA